MPPVELCSKPSKTVLSVNRNFRFRLTGPKTEDSGFSVRLTEKKPKINRKTSPKTDNTAHRCPARAGPMPSLVKTQNHSVAYFRFCPFIVAPFWIRNALQLCVSKPGLLATTAFHISLASPKKGTKKNDKFKGSMSTKKNF